MKFLVWLFCFAVALPAAAQDAYPNKPVTDPGALRPGGATDIIARIVAAKLDRVARTRASWSRTAPAPRATSRSRRRPRPRPTATRCWSATSPPTRSTRPLSPTSSASSLRATWSAITKLVEIPHIVVANASFPANNIAELIALAKKDPGKINYASAGLGSYPHLDMESFSASAASR